MLAGAGTEKQVAARGNGRANDELLSLGQMPFCSGISALILLVTTVTKRAELRCTTAQQHRKIIIYSEAR